MKHEKFIITPRPGQTPVLLKLMAQATRIQKQIRDRQAKKAMLVNAKIRSSHYNNTMEEQLANAAHDKTLLTGIKRNTHRLKPIVMLSAPNTDQF